MNAVPRHIPFNLIPPPSLPRFWPFELAAHVAVPEAAVNENDCPVFRQDDIGFAGQLPVMKPIAEACLVEGAADDHFRFRVFAANAGHHPASCRCIDHIHNQATFLSADDGASIHGFMNSATALTA